MKIVLVRVDDRLIHGQVAVGWTRIVGATHIVVANDEVANDTTQTMLLKMAAPTGVKASILTVDECAEKLSKKEFKNDKVLVLVRDPKTLLRLIDGGVEIKEVNIGNVRADVERKRIIKEVAATPDEIEDWKELDNRNVKLEALWLPDGRGKNFNKIIRTY
jgi:mannose/fructose/N-acetylgalactosamine-specific phosphotransferase system component IIB